MPNFNKKQLLRRSWNINLVSTLPFSFLFHQKELGKSPKSIAKIEWNH